MKHTQRQAPQECCKHPKTRTHRYSLKVHGKSGIYRVCKDCGHTVAEIITKEGKA